MRKLAYFRHFLPEYRPFDVGFRARQTPVPHFEISYTLPSACARALAEGTADIGIIPAAAYAQIPGLQILPGCGDRFAPGGAIDSAGQQSADRAGSYASRSILRL